LAWITLTSCNCFPVVFSIVSTILVFQYCFSIFTRKLLFLFIFSAVADTRELRILYFLFGLLKLKIPRQIM
jgi:hypothetical protein